MDRNKIELMKQIKGLKIIHINTRSVFNKLDELKLRLSHFDIIVFTETWLNCSIHDSLLHWDNFQLVRLDRDRLRNKKGGGVCIYVNTSISFEIVDEFTHLLDSNIEFLYLKIKPHMQKPINLFGIYRPPDGNYRDFLQHITDMIKQIDRSHSETVLIGDFNIDFNNKKLVASSKLNTLETKFALKQIIKVNTRVTDTSSTCIDLLYTDIANIMESGVINYNISDHLPIYLVKKKPRNKIIRKLATGRSYIHYDKDVFSRLFGALDWKNFENSIDPAILWECFSTNIVKVLDIICPIKTLQVVDVRPEWLTNELLIQMRQRDKAFKKARRTKKGTDWNFARTLRNRLCMDIKSAKANTIKDRLERYGPNPKKFWQEVNKLLPHSQDAGIRYLLNESTNTRVEEMDLNEYVNDHFANIGSKLARECTPGVVAGVNNDLGGARKRDNEIANFQRTHFTHEEVLKVCNEINIWKSASIPDVKTMVLKDAFLDNIEKMLKIFNSSLEQSVFPNAWKLSTIVPLPKVKHPSTASDLRPVALTPLPGKLMEKLMCNRFQRWITDNKILSVAQHGFRKGKSTISAIAALLNELFKNINNKKNSYIVYLDLKKAFDTISHIKLLNKLLELGMDGLTLDWFRSYLTERRQCVKLNNLISNTLPITYGVPQGSILGPILFSVYINDISDIVNCGIVLYADDTVIFHHDNDVLQSNLRRISDWCNENLLTINVKKSHWMRTKVCGGDADEDNQVDMVFKVKGHSLTEVDLYKYLGLHIDNNLNFQAHHKKLVSQVQLKLNQFRKIRCFITKKAAILIYKCTILPVLEYADFIQDQGIAYVNKAIQKLQNYGLLIANNQHTLPFNQRDSSETLHRNCKMSRLIHRRRLHLLQFAFRLKGNNDLLDNRDIPTRRRAGIVFTIIKSNHYKFPPKNPYYRCMLEWNNLPVDISLLDHKENFVQAVNAMVANPYMKVL